jgi:hypothetical protein
VKKEENSATFVDSAIISQPVVAAATASGGERILQTYQPKKQAAPQQIGGERTLQKVSFLKKSTEPQMSLDDLSDTRGGKVFN